MATITQVSDTRAQEVLKTVRPKRRAWLWVVTALILVALAVGGAWMWKGSSAPPPVQWQTTAVERGDIVMSATATGNLEPSRTVEIGAEISGRIASVEVDYNDQVKKGQILARIDTETLENDLTQAQASLQASRADIQRSNATFEEARAQEKRLEQLSQHGGVAPADLDSARAARSRASADIQSAQAQRKLNQAKVERAQTQMDKAIITSPIDGVVLERSIEPGNTIAASLQSPSLFLLAEDLSHMELHVSVDEADVGLVKPGQSATFTVDAWPERTFQAKVAKIYLSPTVTSNVVTYTAVLEVNNDDNLLLPGMTAEATITTEKREGALRVPNAALRFTPPSTGQEEGFSMGPRPPGMKRNSSKKSGPQVYVLEQGQPRKVPVRVGRSDGRYTEILSGDLEEGAQVILGQAPQEAP